MEQEVGPVLKLWMNPQREQAKKERLAENQIPTLRELVDHLRLGNAQIQDREGHQKARQGSGGTHVYQFPFCG
jgi:hypothetical protein